MATPNRPLVVGDPSGPSRPYPYRMEGTVISGFGRGSKELGIPTANLPVDDAATPWIASIPSGVYFGWASLRLPPSHPDFNPATLPPFSNNTTTTTSSSSTNTTDETSTRPGANGFQIYPMVMSIGYNPFYKNTVRSAEVHILHAFSADFYGAPLRLLLAGFVRPEQDYSGLDALVADIKFDCDVARRSLVREGWAVREVGVEVEFPGEKEGEGVEKKVVRGTLEGGWLIRPGGAEVVVDGDGKAQ